MNCWLQITSARGPEECCSAVYKVLQILLKEAKEKEIEAKVIESIPGLYPKTLKSVMISINGNNVNKFASSWEGSVLWIEKSKFRPNHKRKNWYIGINILFPPSEEILRSNDFKFEAMKASGPGGQHVNKTSSAIRVTHLPSGLIATALEERSQHMNKKLAIAKLLKALESNNQEKQNKFQQKKWDMHNKLERGNPVRVFKI